jgi:hypothetical protein
VLALGESVKRLVGGKEEVEKERERVDKEVNGGDGGEGKDGGLDAREREKNAEWEGLKVESERVEKERDEVVGGNEKREAEWDGDLSALVAKLDKVRPSFNPNAACRPFHSKAKRQDFSLLTDHAHLSPSVILPLSSSSPPNTSVSDPSSLNSLPASPKSPKKRPTSSTAPTRSSKRPPTPLSKNNGPSRVGYGSLAGQLEMEEVEGWGPEGESLGAEQTSSSFKLRQRICSERASRGFSSSSSRGTIISSPPNSSPSSWRSPSSRHQRRPRRSTRLKPLRLLTPKRPFRS